MIGWPYELSVGCAGTPDFAASNEVVASGLEAHIARTADAHVHHVVVPVAVGVIALAIQPAVFLLAQLAGMQAVRGGKFITPGYTEHSGSPK